MNCAYCGQPAVHKDHVVPRSIVRRQKRMQRPVPEHLLGTVPACMTCNVNKLARCLIPASWAHLLDELNDLGIGKFRVWRGGVDEKAYTETWK